MTNQSQDESSVGRLEATPEAKVKATGVRRKQKIEAKKGQAAKKSGGQ